MMLLLYMLIVWHIQASSADPFNLYRSNNHRDGSCLTYHFYRGYYIDGSFYSDVVYVRELVPFCFRPTRDTSLSVSSGSQHITFAELRQENITSAMLLSWSAAIDTAEQYQTFLNNYSNFSSESGVFFHNCTPPSFGPFCQFVFKPPSTESFTDIVDSLFQASDSSEGPKIACYIHLACRTTLTCLDWREICDGKQDCADGADEQNCWQLEMNECADDEYRCVNGQCISWEFYHDVTEKPDCLDRTDELPGSDDVYCYTHYGFECEEHACRPGDVEFSCGDGQCIIDAEYPCENRRDEFFPRNFCTNATLCSLRYYEYDDDDWTRLLCSEDDRLKDDCSMPFEFQHFALLFGRVRLIVANGTRLPDYVCYDTLLCPHLPPPTASFLNLTCHHFNDLGLGYSYYNMLKNLVPVIRDLFRRCSTSENRRSNCSSSTVYQCLNSTKCISKHRLLDGIVDCPFDDDETYKQSCALSDIRQRFTCREKNNDKCFTSLATENGKKECERGEDEFHSDQVLVYTRISLETICDGITDLLPFFIDGQSETDETGCEPWQCNNTYTRCDGIWACKSGADEADCPGSICPTHHHRCVFPNDTSQISCLPIDRAGDNIDDCLGGTDEPAKTADVSIDSDFRFYSVAYRFRCRNLTKVLFHPDLCNKKSDCPANDDEIFCPNFTTSGNRNAVEEFFSVLGNYVRRRTTIFPHLRNLPSYPLRLLMVNASIPSSMPTTSLLVADDRSHTQLSDFPQACNRGVPVGSPADENILLCLCPPNYYGDRCEYQNQRVTLTLHIRLTADWRTTFVFLITLIDTQTNIESYEIIEYIHTQNCPTKYNIYLLYSTRPKNSSKTFSVRIDAFTHTTLNYRASWIFPLRFAFLPVHRLAVLLRVPFSSTVLAQQKCSPPCIHGQCSLYVNDQHSTGCRCHSGWSGAQCDRQVKCECASDAVCVSESICLCPPGRFGPRCHLSHSPCHSQSCLNGGQCLPINARFTHANTISSICICPEGYAGQRCENRQQQTQIDISIHRQLTLPPSLLVHFIAVRDNEDRQPNRTSVAKKLQFDQSSLTFYTTTSFNIALARMFTDYYLIVLREQTIQTAYVSTQIIPEHRCRSAAELFNLTFMTQHVLKRIKSYHLPCQQHRELMCFYDDAYICLCTLERLANCLEFDHNMTYECQKAEYCGDRGECFQDYAKCATSSFCVCHRCYFGSRCQFSTQGSTLSLDIILGYHIRTKTNINQQPTIVKTATALTSIVLAFGLVDGLLSLQTFREKETRGVGCGLYLLIKSVLSIIIVVILTLKFAFLFTSQIGSMDSGWFLHIQCTLMDFFLRSLVSTNDWLSACVAMERAVSASQGTKFNKSKSRRMARWMIVVVVVVTSCSYIHDAIYRRVMDDEDEQRSWCLTQYPSSVQVLDWTMNILHFSLPFAINAVSALIIIITIARSRSSAQKKKSYAEHLREQLHQHKHLLLSPLILVALALPRLVISFLSGCMESARQSWLYLIGYYISFIPSIMTLLVFVVPSDLYKKQFQETMKRIRHRLTN